MHANDNANTKKRIMILNVFNKRQRRPNILLIYLSFHFPTTNELCHNNIHLKLACAGQWNIPRDNHVRLLLPIPVALLSCFNSIHYSRIGKECFMFRQLDRQSVTRTSQQTVNTISSGLSHQDTRSLMQFWHPVQPCIIYKQLSDSLAKWTLRQEKIFKKGC